MSTTLFNPTNEDLEAQHIGVTTRIVKFPEKGHMVLVDDAKARHLLNILAPRGLMSLDFGDEGDAKKEKAKEGRKRNKDFKMKQIMDFNQLNQANEARKVPYAYPSNELKEYSDEMGIELIAPYALPNVEKGKISKLKEELDGKNVRLEQQAKQMTDMQGQISELTSLVRGMIKTGEDETKSEFKGEDVVEEVVKFRSLNKAQFTAWMKKNWDEIPIFPVEIQEEIKERHEKLFKEPFPESKPE